MNLNQEFWDDRYKNNQTGWDTGEITTPLKTYFDQLENKALSILIPGAGNAYEAEYLHLNGFTNVHVIDISPLAIANFKQRVPSFLIENIHCVDFFEYEGAFDLIIEQTFFCAIDPDLRPKYVAKMSELLKMNGELVGLLFDFPLTENGPPFGGSESEYRNYFEKAFEIKILEKANNSIAPRKGNEFFTILEKL